MARIVDITEKLNFEEPPALLIKGVEIPINDKAVDVIRITPIMEEKHTSAEEFNLLYETVFPEESRKKLEALDLSMKDFARTVWEGAKLIAGADDEGSDLPPRHPRRQSA